MIKRCTCKHEGQDRIHGKGRRVYNEGLNGSACSVCKAETRNPTFNRGKKK